MSVFGFSDLAFMGAVGGVAAYDPDAQAYITAVETADGQVLETAVRDAINAFVVGCKADGIWTALKACCILAGARTLAGALVPLVGPAPTNVGPFVAGDYDRKTGLIGNGSTKYLNSNRADNADPQDSKHLGLYVSQAGASGDQNYIGAVGSGGSAYAVIQRRSTGTIGLASRGSLTGLTSVGSAATTGFYGVARASSASFSYRAGVAGEVISGSIAPIAINTFVFARNLQATGISNPTTARLAFYSIGESLGLALLDARVTALINAFAAAIP